MAVLLRTRALADLLGVTSQTVRVYADRGRIPFRCTPTRQLLLAKAQERLDG